MKNLWLVDEAAGDGPMSAIAAGDASRPAAMADDISTLRAAEPDRLLRRQGDTAVVSLWGLLTRRFNMLTWWYGGTSMEGFAAALQQAIDDAEIRSVVISIDSPGGSYDGTPELTKQIRSQRGAKGAGRIVAVADSMAASAAYWVGSAFERLYVAPSGGVGSIGTWMMHMDYSRMLDGEGITPTMLRSPQWKADLSPFESLPEESKEHYQQLVDGITAEFVAAVASHRGVSAAVVRERFGQGRMVQSKEARAAGMVDGIEESRDIFRRLRGGRPAGRPATTAQARSSAFHRRRRQQLDASPGSE